MNFIFSIILLFGITFYSSFAQAWVKSCGDVYVKFFYDAVTAKEQFAFDGAVKPMADNVSENAFFDRSLYLYAEGGLSNEITLSASLPYKRVITRDASFKYTTYAFGSAQIGTRYKLNELVGITGWADALATNFALTLPLGYTRNFTPSAGAGQVDAEISLNYGRSFHPIPAYAQAGLGFKYRSAIYALSKAVDCVEGVDKNCTPDKKADYGDEITFAISGGYNLTKWLLLTLQTSGVFSVSKPTEGFSVANPIPTKQRYLKIGAGVRTTPIENFGVSFDTAIIPSGSNIFKGIEMTLGLDYSFKI